MGDVSERYIQSKDVMITDDAIVIRWTFTGTHRLLRTEAALSGIALFHLQDGRISKGWITYDTKALDTLSVFKQMEQT